MKIGAMLLSVATFHGRIGLVKALLRLGQDPNETDKLGCNALVWAVVTQRENLVELLLRRGAKPIDLPGEWNGPLLLLAARNDNAAQIERLAQAGGNVNAPDERGMTPLMWAALKGYENNVAVLLRHGADKNAHSPVCGTALDCATRLERRAVMDLLTQNDTPKDN